MVTHDLCTGCGACVQACPTDCLMMKADEHGFLHPKIVNETRCIECQRCHVVCSKARDVHVCSEQPDVYAAFTINDGIRTQSSSGGIFGVIAQRFIDNGGVVCAAVYEERFAVKHLCITDVKDIKKLFGAKYAQSDTGRVFSEIKAYLKQEKPVLFCGTPCQVSGLYAFLGGKEDRLFCVDFVCHGVPSPLVWQNYIDYRRQQDGSKTLPQSIDQRDKTDGWSRYRYAVRYVYASDHIVTIPNYEDLYMRLFIKNSISRESCSACVHKGMHRCSDMTVGDFWGIWEIAPEMDDDKGVSVVMLHSDKAKVMFEEISKDLRCKKVALTDALKMNASFYMASDAHPHRKKILKAVCKGEFDAIKPLLVINPTFGQRLLSKIKRWIIKQH